MGFTTNSLQIENVTPDKAREYLGYNYAHNRPFRQEWAQYLVNEMREGRFMQTAEIHIMYCNGEPVLVNGQHTCRAIVLYGKPVRLTVRKTSTNEYGQVAMMYAFGHDNGRKRTFTDGLGAYNLGEQFGIGSYQTARVAAALKYIRDGYSKPARLKTVPLTEIIDVMGDWVPYARMFWNDTTAPAGELQRIKKGIDKMAVLSLVLLTYRYRTREAKDFWAGIVFPGLNDTDPRWYARRVVSDSIQRANYYNGEDKTPEYIVRRLAKCWGSFVTGKRMGQIPRISDISPSAPIVIYGTPFTGRHPAPPWWPGEEK